MNGQHYKMTQKKNYIKNNEISINLHKLITKNNLFILHG